MDFADHILVPTDFSETSEVALKAAVVLAKQLGAKVTLLHAFDPDSLVPPLAIDPRAYRKRITDEMSGAVAKKLEELRERHLSHVDDVSLEIAEGRGSASTICHAAKRLGADLIVIATTGRTGLSHVLMGSVAERVVRHAHCPVLAVRTEETEA
ncbi:MAG: universal stress protein [Myxococcota bacterium]